MATGSGQLYLTQTGYLVRLEYIDGGDLYADVIRLDSFMATDDNSWSGIKRLYYR